MTQDEIIEMARQAGFKMENSAAIQAAKAFAKLVAAKEREACAKVIENYLHWIGNTAKTEISNAIRARGES